MKVYALILLCTVTLGQTEQMKEQRSSSGGTCPSSDDNVAAVCVWYGNQGELFEHENCNQFYKCSNGQAIPYFCPANLVYNHEERICDWIPNVVCGNRPIVEIELCPEPEEPQPEPDNGGTCNCNPGEAPGICAADGSDGTLVANENCNQFYKCAHGVPVTISCPAGLVYNPHIECCDWPANVDCGDKPITEIGGGDNGNGDNGSGDSGNGDNGSNGGTCNCNPGEAPGICAADGSDGTLVANENCNQFYKCANGVPVTISCPAGLVYNPHIECCDWPANVDCGDKPITEIGGGDNGNGDNGSGDSGNGDNGSNGGTCNCNPGEAPGICAADGSDGTLVANENCNQFYKCANGVPVTISCPAGLVYNPHIECCDWPANVDCGDKPITEIGGGDNGNGDNGSGDSGNGDNGSNGGTCNCNPGEAPGICAADGSDGTLVANENCNQFYKCANGVPVTISCPAGLVYNPHIECCDWPANVDCGDKPITEIGGGDNGNGDNGSGDSGNGDSGSGDSGNGDNGSNGGTCNCNPGEAPGICAADGSDGTLVANENCNQFYKCAHGVPVTISCPAGLVYNPHIECCDWPANVDCGDKPITEIGGGDNGNGDNGSGDSGSGDNGSNGDTCNCNPGEAPGICAADGSDGTLVANENCNQFYKCANGVPVTISCPAGLVYNPYIECCDWPANVDCGDKPIVEGDGGDGDNGSGNGNGDNGNGDNGNGDNDSGGSDSDENGSNEGTCNCNPGEAPGICAVDGSDGTLVANENCNQFYKCANGVPVTISCPAGLVYNPHIECCDWPANVDCGDKPITEIGGGDNGNGDNGSSDNGSGDSGSGDSGNGDNGSNGGTCNCNPGEAPGICAADGSDGTLVANENCNQFYKCANGVPVTISCPAGLVYNPYIECCDWPANVDCGDKPIVEGDGGNGDGDNGSGNGNGENGNGDNGNGDSDSSENGSNEGTCNCNPGEAPGICAVDGSDGTLVAHENCNQFYTCANGAPVAITCPAHLVYNPYTERCDWPKNVECGDKPIVEVDGEGNGNGDNGSGDNGSGDNGSDENGSNEGTCNCNPGEAPGICAADGSDGTLVANENCNQFYKCANGVPVTISCPAGLVYNPHIECCDWPENVDCGDKPIVEIGGGDNGNGDSGNGDNGSGDNGSDENGSNGGTCNCNPAEAPSICAVDGSDGTLIAHENCNKFYKCDHGRPVAFACPIGLLYNPHLEVCDWPENVECGDKPNVEGDGGTGNGDNGIGNGNGDSGSGDSGSGDNGSNGGTCNCNPGEAPAICATGDAEGVLIAHEKCNQFYKCSFGSPVTLRCPGDLLYNPQTEQCDWPLNVECGERVITEGDSSQEQDNQEDGQTGGNKDPSEAPAICAAKDSDGILVAHENCNQFTVCSSGAPVVLFCPGNLLYNPSIEQCDWPANVDCGDRVIPKPEVPEGESSACLCDPKQATSICAGAEANGKMIAHDFCSKYYVCFNGLPIVQRCPTGLFYEPVTRQCTTGTSCNHRLYDVFSFNKHAEARRGLFN